MSTGSCGHLRHSITFLRQVVATYSLLWAGLSKRKRVNSVSRRGVKSKILEITLLSSNPNAANLAFNQGHNFENIHLCLLTHVQIF